MRPERRNHVWSWDFVFDRTHNGRPIMLMVSIGEYTRGCLAVHVGRRARGKEAIDVFADLTEIHGIPEHIRSDKGLEMVAKTLQNWLGLLGTKTIYITPDSPWENGYCESFNGKLGMNIERRMFYTLQEAQVQIDQWRPVLYNTKRPHSSLGYRPPEHETKIPDQEIPMQKNAT